MSKSSASTIFRKVDVDQYDEDRYKDEEGEDISTIGPDEKEVNNLIARDQHKEALLHVLNNAPVGAKSGAVKDKALSLLIHVLMCFKGDIDVAVKSLDSKNLDMLMKYIYRGFADPADNSCPVLLTWHQKVFAVGGLGSIMRVMTDRKGV